MKNWILTCLSVLLFSTFSHAQFDLELIEFASGLDNPLDIIHAGDDRLFVAEQSGIIQIIDAEGSVMPTPFLDITDRVNDSANERGLLGIDFHPDFSNNGYFYVNYTDNSGADTRISRFSVSANNPNLADPDSEEIILEFDQPEWNHNGGCIKFGADGYLYIGTGDGGSGGDPWGSIGNGQNTETLLAKMLRIDVDNGTPYSIPADNPFVDNPAVLDEIWAIGLRNPWRFSFDRETNDLWIGDVGQNEWEEIDYQPANSLGGENYGWKCYEGFETFNPNNCGNATDFVDPVYAYASTSSVGRSVTGGFVYRGQEYPAMNGYYIYADYVSGRIWAISPDGNGGWNNVELLNWTNNQISGFGENAEGELFLAALGQGRIYKLTAACAPIDSDNTTTNVTCNGDADGSISINPNGNLEDFSILWENGATTFDLTGLSGGVYNATITDANGCTTELSETVTELDLINFELEYGNDNELIAPDGFASYQWYTEGDDLIDGATNSIYEFQGGGGWYVVVTDENGCEFTSNTAYIDNLNSIPNLDKVVLTPNPFSSYLNVVLNTSKKLTVSVAVLDLNGTVLVETTENINGSFSKAIELEYLPAGVYFLKLSTTEGQAVRRIIKE